MSDTPTPRTDAIHNTYLTNIFTIDYLTDKLTIESSSLERELTAAREERDRLAEALRNLVNANETWNQGMMDIIGRPPKWNDSYLNDARQALQSLTTNEKLGIIK